MNFLYLQIVRNPNLIWIFLVLFIAILATTFFINKKKAAGDQNFIKNYYEFKYSNDKYGVFIFYSGLLICLTEIIYIVLGYRTESLAIQNFCIGFCFLLLYVLIKKIPFLLKNVRLIFRIIYLFYLLFVFKNLSYNEFNLITYTAFLCIIYFSFTLYNNIKEFILFNVLLVVLISFLFVDSQLPLKTILILSVSLLIISILNYLRNLSVASKNENLLNANEVINLNDTMSIAANRKGEITYCSDSITKILGYKPTQVLGMNFWKLTEDPEFVGEKYHETYIDNRTYVRKLKCEDGSYKYIQWTDKKFSDDLVLAIGKDITEFQQIQNQYINVIDNATDLIFETDFHGHLTFVNNFIETNLGYKKEETINKHFTDFVRSDYSVYVVTFFTEFRKVGNKVETLEFPVNTSDGNTVWLSQKTSVNKNKEGRIIGFSSIARDITSLKKLELEKLKSEQKNKNYNEALKSFTTKSYALEENFDDILKDILITIAKKVDISRVSYWLFDGEKLKCQNLYDKSKEQFDNGFVILKKDYPTYFKEILSGSQVVATNVYEHAATQELIDDYFKKNNIKSLLDTPVYFNGNLNAILCFESNTKTKDWDADDVNFARSIAEVISLTIETQKRKDAEKNLSYKSELLIEVNNITEQFLNSNDTKTLFEGFIKSIAKVTKVSRLSFFENNKAAATFSQTYRWLSESQDLSTPNKELQNFPHKLLDGALNLMLQKKPFYSITNDIRNEATKKIINSLGVKSLLLLPIHIKNELYGFLVFDEMTYEREWTLDEISILSSLTNNISASIERNLNEKLIFESEEKFRLLADNIPGTIYLSKNDTHFTKLYLNNQIETLTGYPKSDFLENKIQYGNLIHKDDIANVKQLLEESVQNKKPYQFSYRITKKNKQTAWIQEFGEGIEKNGVVDYFEGIFLDITDKKIADEKLAYKSDLLSAIAKITNQFLVSTNVENNLDKNLAIIGNAAKVDRVYYFTNSEDNKTVSQKYEWVNENAAPEIDNPELQDYSHDNFPDFMQVLYSKRQYNFLVKDLKNDTYKKHLQDQNILSILILPIFVKEQLHSFIGFDDCTTERLWTEDEINILQTLANNISSALERSINETMVSESEEKFKIIANNIPGTVYLAKFDKDHTKVYLNDEIEILSGYAKNEFLENKLSYIELIHPDDKEQVLAEQYNNIENNKPIHSIYRIRKKSGDYVWVEEFGDSVKKDGIVEYIGGIYIDITQKKEAEKAFEERDYAENANRAKSDFLANMSHEIRTPLNGIIGFTDLLMNTKLETIQKQYMNTINQSANLLMEVINDVLDFSKIEAGKIELEIEKHDIQDLTSQIIQLLTYQSNLKEIDLFLNIDKQVPKYIWIDAVRIKQILVNLLSNAIKFTEKGKIELNITTQKSISPTIKVLRFAVKDTGIGIKKENQDKIFNAFSQEDSSTTRKFGGTGLGLSISNKLLELTGSKLQIDSEYTKGSEFFFDVRLKCSDVTDVEKEIFENVKIEIDNTEYLKNNPIQENYKVMIVEDNKINMLLAKTLIKQIVPNVSIYELSDGKQAVEKFEIIKPDLILMDVQMPVMNGYEATIAIRKMKNSDIPIIALTAGTVVGEKEKCIEIGMNDYASKPIVKDVLEKVIAKWLHI